MPKDNSLFRLDNLDYQYHYLSESSQKFRPRLNGTWKTYNATGKKGSKRASKLLSGLKIENVKRELNELYTDIFKKKVFHLEVKLRQFIEKQLIQYKPGKKSKTDFTPVIDNIKADYGLEKFVELISKSKAIKLSLSKVRPTSEGPEWFTNYDFWQIHNNKDHEYNPSRIWNEVILKIEGCNQLLSSLLNNNKCKELIAGFNSGMDVLLNINKDKKKKDREDNSSQSQSQLPEGQKDQDEENGGPEDQLQDEDEDEQLTEETLQRYDGMLGASDDEEDEEDDGFQLDPNVDYNEVSDDEPSDDESSDDKEEQNSESESEGGGEPVKPKYQLPELMSGYYDGGESSEDNLANDKIAKEQISNKNQRKNRRGQRARRKIWEQKYGNKANHVVKERQAHLEKKRKRQQEFEEREAKRAKRALEAAKHDDKVSNPSKNDAPRKSESKPKPETPQADHPSWIAKRETESKLRNVKFEGKKITFD